MVAQDRFARDRFARDRFARDRFARDRFEGVEWALLSYRIPREPSTPRIAVWRKLKQLGVDQVGDGLVALPDDARNREHLEWIAADVISADGDAAVWVARTSRTTSESTAHRMRAARDDEYESLIAEVAANGLHADRRTLHRWRRTLRNIERRDYFRAPLRDRARLAVDQVAAELAAADPTASEQGVTT